MMGGMSSVFAALFGVVWTVIAGRIMPFMALFGIIFILMAVVNAVYNFKNATGENRYSEYDITEDGEETDPFNEMFQNAKKDFDGAFCPYCGAKVEKEHIYCNRCGKKL